MSESDDELDGKKYISPHDFHEHAGHGIHGYSPLKIDEMGGMYSDHEEHGKPSDSLKERKIYGGKRAPKQRKTIGRKSQGGATARVGLN